MAGDPAMHCSRAPSKFLLFGRGIVGQDCLDEVDERGAVHRVVDQVG